MQLKKIEISIDKLLINKASANMLEVCIDD